MNLDDGVAEPEKLRSATDIIIMSVGHSVMPFIVVAAYSATLCLTHMLSLMKIDAAKAFSEASHQTQCSYFADACVYWMQT